MPIWLSALGNNSLSCVTPLHLCVSRNHCMLLESRLYCAWSVLPTLQEVYCHVVGDRILEAQTSR
jgi:hypothetical protein